MKRLTSIFFAGLLFLSGCRRYEIDYSEIKKEDAIVAEKNDYPEQVTIIPVDGGAVPIIDFEIYNVYFEGEISFIVNNKKLYNKFNVGDSVELSYEEYGITIYTYLGPLESEMGKLREYHFIEAKKK